MNLKNILFGVVTFDFDEVDTNAKFPIFGWHRTLVKQAMLGIAFDAFG